MKGVGSKHMRVSGPQLGAGRHRGSPMCVGGPRHLPAGQTEHGHLLHASASKRLNALQTVVGALRSWSSALLEIPMKL